MDGLGMIVVGGLVMVVILLVVNPKTITHKFARNGGEGGDGVDLNWTTGMYQYSNANPTIENDYFACVAGLCGGNTTDYDCLEKCKIKSFQGRARTVQDLVCSQYSAPHEYYRCLDQIYSDYRFP